MLSERTISALGKVVTGDAISRRGKAIRTLGLTLSVISLVGMLTSETVRACGCCASRGTWLRSRAPLTEWERENVEAAMYSGTLVIESEVEPMDPDLPCGSITARFSEGIFVMGRLEPNGQTHELIRVLCSDTCEFYRSDTGSGSAVNAVLFKELVFKGTIEVVDERLSKYIGDRGWVILLGHGNNCFDPADLERWIVRFEGKGRQVAHGVVNTDHLPLR